MKSMYKEKTFFEYFDSYRNRYREYENKSLEELKAEIMTYADSMSREDHHMIDAAFSLGKKVHE